MAKADRVLNFFPSFFGAMNPNKLLYRIAHWISIPLEEADTTLFRIQRAHRLPVAEHTEDILRLAAVLNLSAIHFEDILANKEISYELKLEMMKQRVQRIARLHLIGLGTPWAIFESASIFLDADIVEPGHGKGLIRHIDLQGYSHTATIEFASFPDRTRETIELHENPYRRRTLNPRELWNLNAWYIENQNFDPSGVRILIQGVEDRTVLPSVLSIDTEEGILFNGIVPKNLTLVIDQTGSDLEGQAVDDWLLYFKGGIFEFSKFDTSDFVVEQPASEIPFSGLLPIFSRPYIKAKTQLSALPGRTQWRYHAADGVWNQHLFNYATYTTPSEPIGFYDLDFTFDHCVFDYLPSCVLGIAWDERIPCSFKIVLPRMKSAAAGSTNNAAPENADESSPALNPVNVVGNILPRFKAAGIRAFVDEAKDSWILGRSVMNGWELKDEESISHSTRLHGWNAGSFVPLDI